MPYFPTMQKFVQTDEQTNKTWLALACVLLVKHLTTTLFLFVLCGATLTFTLTSTKHWFRCIVGLWQFLIYFQSCSPVY